MFGARSPIARNVVAVIAWWFISVSSGHSWVAVPIGPFQTEEQCKQHNGFVVQYTTRVSGCWWDGKN